jgi:hypothetical protein
VRFAPQSAAPVDGTVSFGNSDPDENPYSFAIAARHFNPLSVAGCELWLDAADTDGDGVAESGGSLASWVDKSGQANHATQPTSSKQPQQVANQLNGNPVVRFDGSDDMMSFPELSDIRTVFWVVEEDAGTSDTRFLLGHSSSYEFHRGLDSSPSTIWNSTYASSSIKNGTTRLDGNVVNGTTTEWPQGDYHRLSLVTTGNVHANQLTQDRNYGRSWDGGIAELIVYNTALSDADRLAVADYLQTKWFDANHAPEFVNDPVVLTNAVEGSTYAGTLSGTATDPDAGDTLTFAKASGPAWLSVAADGTLGGTSAPGDTGTNRWVVVAADGHGGVAQAILSIVVQLSPQGFYTAWLSSYPGLGSATNWMDNPDGDLLENLAEYSIGGNPLVPDVGNSARFHVLEAGGSNWVEYVYAQRNDATERGLSYWLESRTNMLAGSWTNANANVVGTGVLDAEFDSVTNRIPATGETQFIQLKIECR